MITQFYVSHRTPDGTVHMLLINQAESGEWDLYRDPDTENEVLVSFHETCEVAVAEALSFFDNLPKVVRQWYAERRSEPGIAYPVPGETGKVYTMRDGDGRILLRVLPPGEEPPPFIKVPEDDED